MKVDQVLAEIETDKVCLQEIFVIILGNLILIFEWLLTKWLRFLVYACLQSNCLETLIWVFDCIDSDSSPFSRLRSDRKYPNAGWENHIAPSSCDLQVASWRYSIHILH